MNYPDTLDYLFSRLPMFSRIGAAAYKANLDNTYHLLEACGNPHKDLKCIHIAGTNGKGSVSHMLAAILQTAGYKTGLYTSPHLRDFRERIRINGEMIPEENVISFTEAMKPLVEEISPSFFELTVAMAFRYFADERVDIAVIETGLGGRLDSTNVVTPVVSVITNIGWDHMNLLGDSLQQIAGEKAGIIKPNIPVVVGEVLPETRPVFDRVAAANDAALHYPFNTRSVEAWYVEHEKLVIETAHAHHVEHHFYHLDLMGLYQSRNLLTVLETVSVLQESGWRITQEHIKTGLTQVKKMTGLHGRWEIIHRHPLVIMDVAHNEAGIRMLMEQVQVTPHHKLHIVIGMAADKEVAKLLTLFPATASYYFTQAAIPRALDSAILKEKAATCNLYGNNYLTVSAALEAAMTQAGKDDLVLVCGSVFVVGEVIINT